MEGTSIRELNREGDNGEPQNEDMQNLARDINNGLEDVMVETEMEEEVVGQGIIDIVKEPLVLLIIYVMMSHESVRMTLGRYISQINPGQDGAVTMTGVVIYGIIFVMIFMLVKKYLLQGGQ